MKTTSIITISLLLVVTAVARPGCPTCGAAKERNIDMVRAVYSQIQAADPISTTLAKINLPNTPGGQSLTKRVYQNGLMAITLERPGDHGESLEHFYYQNGKPVFILTQDFTRTGFPDSRDSLVEHRFYLGEKSCLRAVTREVTATEPSQNASLRELISKLASEEADTDRLTSAQANAQHVLNPELLEGIEIVACEG